MTSIRKDTKTTLSVLFAIAMVGMLSVPAHAQVNTIGSSITAGGDIIQSVTVLPVDTTSTTIEVDIAFAPDTIGDPAQSLFGVDVTISDGTITTLPQRVDMPLATFVDPDTIRVSFDVAAEGLTIGNDVTITAEATPLRAGELIPNQTPTTGVFTVIIAACGYENVSDINYGVVARGATSNADFQPTITDAARFLQPTDVTFDIGAFEFQGTPVVNADQTSIDGNVGPSVTVNGVVADQTFGFSTTLNFINANAFAISVGNEITQTTTITPVCGPATP